MKKLLEMSRLVEVINDNVLCNYSMFAREFNGRIEAQYESSKVIHMIIYFNPDIDEWCLKQKQNNDDILMEYVRDIYNILENPGDYEEGEDE